MSTMSRQPVILDLYCGAGGASRGYKEAGFRVVGVDHVPPTAYGGDEFIEAEALDFVSLHGIEFDAIHASPPCQAHSLLVKGNQARGSDDYYPDLIPKTRAWLDLLCVPYVIENVPLSGLRPDLMLCGTMFGLGVIRHRLFEMRYWPGAPQLEHASHQGTISDGEFVGVYGRGGGKDTTERWQEAMGIDWVDTRAEIAEAIPPAYTRYIGETLIKGLML